MFRDRLFNISILISFAWHLFWILSVGIVVTPSVQSSNVYQEVDFLGPILEKTAFDLMVEEVTPSTETLYARNALFLDRVYLKPKGPERKVLKEAMPRAILNRFAFYLSEFMKDSKEVPQYFSEDSRGVYAKTGERISRASMEGPAGEREVIFKPERVTVPRGLYDDREEYVVKLKFYLSYNGIVRDVEPVISSGYPGIDLQAIRFLKRWRFSPLSIFEKDKAAWGIVAVKIKAE